MKTKHKISKGLMIKAPWCELILEGRKTWEIRGSRTHIRGTIGVIESGTGTIIGTVDLIDCYGPLSPDDMSCNLDKHHIESEFSKRTMPYAQTYAWVVENPTWFEKPKRYKHPSGAIIWVNLEK